jgi:thiamine kinase-like enzyme
MLIDYEYSGWNPMAMDLANYVNETMFDKNTLKFIPENCMTVEEVENMAVIYLNDYWDKYLPEMIREEYSDKEYFIHFMKPVFVSDI